MKHMKHNPNTNLFRTVYIILFVVCLIIGVGTGILAADYGERHLLNGSFENSQSWRDSYIQIDQASVPSWNTTAFQGKIELFRKNTGVYIRIDGKGVILAPSDGQYGAELNADEESTLYQVVKTTQSSVYEWGLDHGARNLTDVMALVIGPKQPVNPSKPSKDGRDHFMQMADWLKNQGEIPSDANGWSDWISEHPSGSEPVKFVIYSKKFASGGKFEDNAGNNAFSFVPSTLYTEEWHIWIIADARVFDENFTNKWFSYGSNANGSAGDNSSGGVTNVDLNKYYLYTVPAGQTETLFGFVSVGFIGDGTVAASKATTYGNFIDKINFQLYHPFSCSSTSHGSAIIGSSSGNIGTEGGSGGSGGGSGSGSDDIKISVNDKFTAYVTDGNTLLIKAIVTKEDIDAGCEFVGLYRTVQEGSSSNTSFVGVADLLIEDSEDLTEEEKAGKWVRSYNADGSITYTYHLTDLTSATDLHFVFIKHPTVTYDTNGGKEYVVDRMYNTSEALNVYSFKPFAENGIQTFIPPYTSKAAEGQNSGWKFMGWLVTGDKISDEGSEGLNGNETSSLFSLFSNSSNTLDNTLIPAVHTITCDYSVDAAQGKTAAQHFKVYSGNTSLTENVIEEGGVLEGVQWDDNGEVIIYENDHKGITMVAQWRWLQVFTPQVNDGDIYKDSNRAGNVEIISVTNKSDTNYNGSYDSNGSKSYDAAIDETVTVKAVANSGYTFEGWYDSTGKLVTTNATYSYVETKESVNTFYARFSGSVTQTYIRQVKDGDTWKNTTDNSIGTLGRYTYTDAVGLPISSTATEGSNYKFVGWYDADGNKVPDDMLINDGLTISYTTVSDAVYYARFERAYTVKFVTQTKQVDGSFKTNNTGGKVSVTSGKDVVGNTVRSVASANKNYKFMGWYDKSGNFVSSSTSYVAKVTAENGVTYYARFEVNYIPNLDSKSYVSFVAESEKTGIPSEFEGRDAGTGINAGYGLEDHLGNTVSTGFRYSLNTNIDLKTIQITIRIPAGSFVKVGSSSIKNGLEVDGIPIVEDSDTVIYNRGSIQTITDDAVMTCYWDASSLEANVDYGFILDGIYAPNATAVITVNGTSGVEVTEVNGVVNTSADKYRDKSHYPKP